MDPVDLALVLAFDGSASVTYDEFGLMATGVARALRDAEVIAGLLGGRHKAALGCVLLWSAAADQEVMVEWTRLGSESAVKDFADQVDNMPRIVRAGVTGLGAALLRAVQLLAQAPAEAGRHVIDMVGDGASNDGIAPGPVRDAAVGAGITINGLCVLHEEPDLLDYYTRAVIGGAGSFALACADYAAFADAMRQKLAREVA